MFSLHLQTAVDHQRKSGFELIQASKPPLHLAAGRGLNSISSTLCEAGADSLLLNVEDETPQDLAEDLLSYLPFDDLKISGKPLLCTD